MKKFIWSFLFGVITLSLYAQSDESIYEQAEEMLDLGNWNEAFNLYSSLLKKYPDNANLNFKAGYVLLNNGDAEKSIVFLEKAIKNIDTSLQENVSFNNKKAPLETYYYLGKAYHQNYKFEESLIVLSKLKKYLDPKFDEDFIENIDLVMRYDTNGSILIKTPVKMEVQNLGGNVNSIYSEHSPVFTADENMLFFTSTRSNGKEKLPNGEYDEDIYFSISDDDGRWEESKSIGNLINTKDHDATVSISIDGRELFIYREDDEGSIYVSVLDNNNQWTNPKKLPKPINSKYRETHASLGADNMTLYFTSDRPGGFGGLDIYVVKRLPNGEWGIPQNLGPQINTPFDEEGPYIHPDGKTLFFSSKGHNSMGGYDIFYSFFDEEKKEWTKPQNLGYPINTTMDDVFYVPTPDGKRAYYASKQFNSLGKTDIFLITIPGLKEKGLTVLSGYIVAADGSVPENIVITVTDVKTGNLEGIYTPNPTTGKYLFILRPGKTYNVSIEADGYSYYSENITVAKGSSYKKIKRTIKLKPIILGDVNEEYFVKFEMNEDELSPGIKRELDNMARFLNVNKDLNLTIDLSNPNVNMELNNRRKNAIKKYLVNKGVEENRIFTDKDVEKSIKLTILNNSDAEPEHKYGKYLIGLLPNNSLSNDQRDKIKNVVEIEDKNKYFHIVADNQNVILEIKKELIKNGVPESSISYGEHEKSDAINLIANVNIFVQIEHNVNNDFLTEKEKKELEHFINSYGKTNYFNIITQNKKIAELYKSYLIQQGVKEVVISDKINPVKVNIQILEKETKYPVVKLEVKEQETKLDTETKEKLNQIINKYGKNKKYFIGDKNNTRTSNIIKFLKSKGLNAYKLTNNKVNGVKIKVYERIGEWSELSIKNYDKNAKEVKVYAILFDFDKWRTTKFDDILYNLYYYMKNNPGAQIALHGYTDNQGSKEYNIILSRKRAQFVKDFLVTKGIEASRIRIYAHGKDNQISIDISPETRKYNRRVEFSVIRQGNKQKLICIPVQVPEKYKIKIKKE